MWRFRKILWPSQNKRALPTYFLYGKLLTYSSRLFVGKNRCRLRSISVKKFDYVIDLSFQSKKDKRGLPEKMTEETKFTSRAYIFPNYIFFFCLFIL